MNPRAHADAGLAVWNAGDLDGRAIWSAVEMRQLRAFLAVADELHFGRAAERLGVTPSYVSQVIRTLEARVGGRLFERTSRRVRLTPVGEQLLAEVTSPYRELQQALSRANQAAVGVAGVLRVGMYTEHLVGRHMVEIVRLFKARYPTAEVVFTNSGLERNYLEVLRAGEVEMLATRLPLSDRDLTLGPILSRERRVLLVAEHDPLAERQSVTLEDFADRAVSDAPALPREMIDALIPPVTPSGTRYRRIANRSIEEMLMRIALGEQVHPTVSSFLEHHAHPAIVGVPLRELAPSETALVWVTANESPKIRAFARAAADVLAGTDLAS